MLSNKPHKLTNTIQNYDWGSRGKNAYIPALLSIDIEPNQPYAELWIGAHDKAPSRLEINGRSVGLNELSQKSELYENSENKLFPYLLKVLSASNALSIQTHPNKEQAVELHKNDSVNYADDNHKPEIAIAVDHLKALAGFRPLPEIKDVLEEYTCISVMVPDISEKIINLKEDSDAEKLFDLFYKAVLKTSIEKPECILEAINSIEENILSNERVGDHQKLFLDLRKKYQGPDIGLISIFFLNYITLNSGEALFIKAGVPHAYLEGNIIECMANSDNVVRAGLTSKFVDIENLVDILDYSLGLPKIIKRDDSQNIFKYETPVDDFEISAIQLGNNESLNLTTSHKPVIILILEGVFKIKKFDEEWAFKKGESFLLPHQFEDFKLLSDSERSLAYIVKIP